jgi:hypothetical protein
MAAAQEGRRDPNLHHRLAPHLRSFNATFGAWQADLGQARLRYVPTGVTASDVPLEQLQETANNKVSPFRFWVEAVRPRFLHLDPRPKRPSTAR